MEHKSNHSQSHGDSTYPTNSPEDKAVRHVNAIMYNIPEVRNVMGEKKTPQAINPAAAPMNEHIDGLAKIRTQLKNIDAQISVQRLKEAHKKFQQAPSDENLTAVAREAFHLGHQLSIAECHIGSHIEEMKAATHVLNTAVRKNDNDTVLHQKHVIHILMGNLLLHKDSKFFKDIQQLHQNFLLFRTIGEPSPEDVSEWHKALNEFPPVT